MVRVPTFWTVDAVIYQLDIPATHNVDPPGTPTSGYDPLLREPVIYDNAADQRTSSRREKVPVILPVQFETATFEELREVFTGDDPVTNVVLVAWRKDLQDRSLIDVTTGNCVLKPGDRIVRLEKNGRPTRTFIKPLYIYSVLPGSPGFGPDGYDLEIIYTSHRNVGV